MEESFFRGSGVELQHRPTGIRIRCCQQRSQALNRFLARRLLADELEARLLRKTRHEVKAEKIREAKRKWHRPSVGERLAQFTLRPIAAPDQQPSPKGLGKLLAQRDNLEKEERR